MTRKNDLRRQRRLMPPITALTAFDAVVRLGGFTAAARELALTQSAVSRQVSALEEMLGVDLLERNRRRQVVLTASGRYYAEQVREILSHLVSATTEAIALDDFGRILRLGIPPTFGSLWLIPRMRSFFESHPDISVEFSTRIPSQRQTRPGALHALIDFAPSAGAEATWDKLFDSCLSLVATPEIAKGIATADPAVMSHTHLLVHAIERARLSEMLASEQGEMLRPLPILSFESYTMVLHAAIKEIGIALAPTELMEADLMAGRLVPISGWSVQAMSSAYLIYEEAMDSYPPLLAFREWLLAEVAKMPSSGAVLKGK